MIINIFGAWLTIANILYLQPLDKGCEIVTKEKNTRYTTAIDCEEVAREFNRKMTDDR